MNIVSTHSEFRGGGGVEWFWKIGKQGGRGCSFSQITFFKGNPNSQSLLNWIIQILHYRYSKQHKHIENSQITEQNLVISLSLSLSLSLPFSLFTTAYASFTFLAAELFQFFKRQKWSFVKYIVFLFWFENGFLQVRPS